MRIVRLLTWATWFVRPSLSIILALPLLSYANTTSCNISMAGGINFIYNTSGSTVNGTINAITCNYVGAADPVFIYLTNSGSVNPRQMTSGANTLNYDLYTDAAYTLIWGDGLSGTSVRGPFTCDGASPCSVNLSSPNNLIYGKIPANSAMPGSYQQMITAVVSNSPSGGPILGSTSFPVATNVASSCSASATNVLLNYPANSPTAVTSNSVLHFQCNAPGSYLVTLQSANSGTSNGSGILKDANNHVLAYQLYQPVNNQPNAACAYTIAWGSSPGMNLMLPNTNVNNYNACLSVPPFQNTSAGNYSDTVNVVINF